MKVALTILLCLQGVLFSVQGVDQCEPTNCLISDNCRCSSTQSPIPTEETPQFISLTSNEALIRSLYVDIWKPLLTNRRNPDGNPISGTFFVPQEYTDYSSVHDLYVQGFEIGVASSIFSNDFGNQRIRISQSANIPIEDIIGARASFQSHDDGDTLINTYVAAGINYDSSLTTWNKIPSFPYTLDYLLTQECLYACPEEPHPGFWITPIISIMGNQSACIDLIACYISGSADEIASWLLREVQRLRTSNRTPLTLDVPSAWFRLIPNSYEGFRKFLDLLSDFDDIFLVSEKQVIDWVKNPVPLGKFKTDTPQKTTN